MLLLYFVTCFCCLFLLDCWLVVGTVCLCAFLCLFVLLFVCLFGWLVSWFVGWVVCWLFVHLFVILSVFVFVYVCSFGLLGWLVLAFLSSMCLTAINILHRNRHNQTHNSYKPWRKVPATSRASWPGSSLLFCCNGIGT